MGISFSSESCEFLDPGQVALNDARGKLRLNGGDVESLINAYAGYGFAPLLDRDQLYALLNHALNPRYTENPKVPQILEALWLIFPRKNMSVGA